jgi:hypothetical protein
MPTTRGPDREREPEPSRNLDPRVAEEVDRIDRLIAENRPPSDSLPGPKVFLMPAPDQGPRDAVAHFQAWVDERPGYIWPRWRVTGAVSMMDGQLGLSQLSITPWDGDQDPIPITRTLLRDLPVTEIFHKVRAMLVELPGRHTLDLQAFPHGNPLSGKPWSDAKERAYKEALSLAARIEGPGDKYARAAHEYLQLRREGWTRGLYEELGHRLHVQERRARSLVEAAVAQDLLRKAGERGGKLGYKPSPRLLRWQEEFAGASRGVQEEEEL